MRFLSVSLVFLLLINGCFFSKPSGESEKSSPQTHERASTVAAPPGQSKNHASIGGENHLHAEEAIGEAAKLLKEHNELQPTETEAKALADYRESLRQDKGEAMESLRVFKKLVLSNPDAAKEALSKFAKLTYGEHAFVEAWSALYFRLVRDGKGPLSDHIRLTELDLQMLMDKDPEKHAEFIRNARRTLEQYEVMAKMCKLQGETPETFEMKFTLILE